jgi:hypothetical protein
MLVRLVSFFRAGDALKVTSRWYKVVSMSTRLFRSNSPTFRVIITIVSGADKLAFWDMKIICVSFNDYPLWRGSFEVFFLMGGSLNIQILKLQ